MSKKRLWLLLGSFAVLCWAAYWVWIELGRGFAAATAAGNAY